MAERRRHLGTAFLAALIALPLLALVVRALAAQWRAPSLVPQGFSMRGLDIAFSGSSAAAFQNSLVVGVATTVVALLIGWPAARVLGERRLSHPAPVFLLLAAPLLVPSYAVGTGLTPWFIRLGVDGTLPAVVLAHLTFVLPYVILVLVSGFGPGLRRLDEMADVSGLSRRQRLLWVTLPASAPTLGAASLLGFLVSWSDYGSSLAVGGGRSLLPVVLLPFVGADPQVAAALALVFLAPAIVVLAFVTRAGRMPL